MLSSGEEGKRNASMEDLLVSTTTNKPPRHCPPSDFLRTGDSLRNEELPVIEKRKADECGVSSDLKKQRLHEQSSLECVVNTGEGRDLAIAPTIPSTMEVNQNLLPEPCETILSSHAEVMESRDTGTDTGTCTGPHSTAGDGGGGVEEVEVEVEAIPQAQVTSSDDTVAIDTTTNPAPHLDCSFPSICIPGIDASVNEELVRSVIGEVRFGKIQSISFLPVDEYMQTVLVHFSAWNEVDDEAKECRRRLLAREQIRVMCDVVKGWFWLISAAPSLPPETSSSSSSSSSSYSCGVSSLPSITTSQQSSLSAPSQQQPPPLPPTSLSSATETAPKHASSDSCTAAPSSALPLAGLTVGGHTEEEKEDNRPPCTSSVPLVVPAGAAAVHVESSSCETGASVLPNNTSGDDGGGNDLIEEVTVIIEGFPDDKIYSKIEVKDTLMDMFMSFRGFVGLRYSTKRRRCCVTMKNMEDATALLRHLSAPGIRMTRTSDQLVGRIAADKSAGGESNESNKDKRKGKSKKKDKEKQKKSLESLIQRLKGVGNNKYKLESVVIDFLYLEDEELEPQKTIIYDLLYPYKFISAKSELLLNVGALLDRLLPQSFAATVLIEGFDKRSPTCSPENIEEMFRSFRGFVTSRYLIDEGHCSIRMDSVENAEVLVAHLASPGIRMSRQSLPLRGRMIMRRKRARDDDETQEAGNQAAPASAAVSSSSLSSAPLSSAQGAKVTVTVPAPAPAPVPESASTIGKLINRLKTVGDNREELNCVVKRFLKLDFQDIQPQKTILLELLLPYKYISARKKILKNVKTLLHRLTWGDDAASVLIKGFDKCSCTEEIIDEMFRSFRGFITISYQKERGQCYIRMDSVENANALVAHLQSPGIQMSAQSAPLTGSLHVRNVGHATTATATEDNNTNTNTNKNSIDTAYSSSGGASARRLQEEEEEEATSAAGKKEWMALALNDFLKFSTVLDS